MFYSPVTARISSRKLILFKRIIFLFSRYFLCLSFPNKIMFEWIILFFLLFLLSLSLSLSMVATCLYHHPFVGKSTSLLLTVSRCVAGSLVWVSLWCCPPKVWSCCTKFAVLSVEMPLGWAVCNLLALDLHRDTSKPRGVGTRVWACGRNILAWNCRPVMIDLGI